MNSVLLIFGTRPEAIKLAPLISELRSRDSVQTIVCSTGQHREMLKQILDQFEIKPDYEFEIMSDAQSLADITVRALGQLTSLMEDVAPDMVIVQGDTTTALSGALAAYYLKIPLAHVEAGLRSGDNYQPFPEEVNRSIIDLISDINFAPTELSAQNLLNAGISQDRILVTGNTVVDALNQVMAKLNTGQSREFVPAGLKSDLVSRIEDCSDTRMILLTSHRRESFGEGLENIFRGVRDIVERNPEVEIIFPVHMNPNVRHAVSRTLVKLERVHLIEPTTYFELVWLLSHCYLVITDSGGLQEEAPTLGKPVLVTRAVTERQEAIIAGSATVVGTDQKAIVANVENLLHDPEAYRAMSRNTNLFGNGNSSIKIADALEAWLDHSPSMMEAGPHVGQMDRLR